MGKWNDGEKVPVETIDSLNLSALHFVKIDVEGMETEVMRGATETLRRHRPILYVENDRAIIRPSSSTSFSPWITGFTGICRIIIRRIITSVMPITSSQYHPLHQHAVHPQGMHSMLMEMILGRYCKAIIRHYNMRRKYSKRSNPWALVVGLARRSFHKGQAVTLYFRLHAFHIGLLKCKPVEAIDGFNRRSRLKAE